MTSRRGLVNLGNTCYLNSAIQALRHSKPFQDYFGTDAWISHEKPDRKDHALVQGAVAVMRDFKEETATQPVRPASLLHAFIKLGSDFNDEIRYGAQADAAEAVQILLDGLHTQQAREVRMDVSGRAITPDQGELIKSLESWASFFRKEYSPLVEQFYGQTQTRITCKGCGNKSTRYEPWGVLKLPIPNAEKAGAPAPNLAECLAAAMASETIDEYACDGCNKRGPAVLEHAISRMPRHLILSLKRFTNTGAKVRARIAYDPDKIVLTDHRAWSSIQGSANDRVMSTIEHMGSSRGGHYYMRAREGSEWIEYDDDRVGVAGMGGAAGLDTYMLFLEMSDK